MKKLIQQIFSRRWLRVMVWILITGLTGLVLLRQYVGWSGSRRWSAVQQMLNGEGESLDFQTIAPVPVEEEANFCAIAPLKGISLSGDEQSEFGLKRKRLQEAELPKSADGVARPPLAKGASTGKGADLRAWAQWLRKEGSLGLPADSGNPARELLAGLAKQDGLVEELALGLNRPEGQWTPAWKVRELPENLFSIQLPHLSAVMKLTQMLGLRGTAAARAQDSAKAHQAALIATRLSMATAREPFLIGSLVACSTFSHVGGMVWELCDSQCGSAREFEVLEQTLAGFNFQDSMLMAERAEMAGSVNAVEWMRRTRDISLLQVFGAPNQNEAAGWLALTTRLIPDGWFNSNAATLAAWHFEYSVSPLRAGSWKELMAKQRGLAELLHNREELGFYQKWNQALALQGMPALSSVSATVIYTQAVLNQTIVACALERYRIEHGEYPESLSAVDRASEKPLPLDPLTEKSMGYRRTKDGKYALWCVGPDGLDDGGKRGVDSKHPENTRYAKPEYLGDWVWDFSGK